jgi:hypothetical protein
MAVGRWFRVYDDIINDPKVLKLSLDERWYWIAMLCIASKHSGKLPPADDLAFLLRVKVQQAAAIIARLERAGLLDKVDGGFVPHNWDGRQYLTDVKDPTAAHRSKRYRDRKAGRDATHRDDRDATRDVTRDARDAAESVKRPDTDTEADTEQNRAEKKEPRARALVPLGWPPDFFEQFWLKYPNKVDKAGALKALTRVGNKGAVPWQTIMDGLNRYAAKADDRPWCNPTTWINQARWEEQHATVRTNNGFRIGNTRRAGHDAILASATRKARKLDQQDGLARSENQIEPASRIDAHNDRTRGDGTAFGGDQGDHHGLEFDPCRVLEGEIIAPDKNAACVPDSGQLV